MVITIAPAHYHPLAGRCICITGQTALSRTRLRQAIELRGGTVSDRLRGCDYLVHGSSPGSRLHRAQRLCVPVITEARLLELVAGR